MNWINNRGWNLGKSAASGLMMISSRRLIPGKYIKLTQWYDNLSKTFLESTPPSGLSALRSTVRPDSISVQFPSNAEICGTSSSSGRPCSFRLRPSPSPLSRHMLSRALLLLSPPLSLSPPPKTQSLRTNRELCLIFFFVMKYYFYFPRRLKKFDHCHTWMTFETLKAKLNQCILFIFFKSSRWAINDIFSY